MTINVEEGTKIVDTWFEHQHEKIIEKLANNKAIQLKYLKRIIYDKEDIIRKLMNEPSSSQEVNNSYNKYRNFLELHIELLCEIEPDEVLPVIKKEYYPVNECQAICNKKGHLEGKAYLLKRAGDYNMSLKVYLEILKNIKNALLNFSTVELFEVGMMKFYTQFSYALEVCLENAKVTSGDNSGESLWFTLLSFLYDMMLQTSNTKSNTEIYEKLNDLITYWIKQILYKMMNYISSPVIMTRLTEKHGELEIQSFKEMFDSMLSSYFYNEKILETATMITSNELAAQFKALSSLHFQGFLVKETVCAKCEQKIIEDNENEMVIFQCGHIYHDNCYDKKTGCYFCSYKDISKRSN